MSKQYKKMQALADSAKKKESKTENVLDSVREAKVGIQGFIKKGNGFSAKLKQCYSDFQVHEISIDGKIVHLTDLNQFIFSEEKKERLSLARKYQDSNTVPLQPLYTEFVLYMENQETLDAKSVLSKIAKKNKIHPQAFWTAGSKHESRTITCQLVTAENLLDPKKLKCDLNSDCKVAFGNFTFTDKSLQQGNLKGQRFVIAFRDVIGHKSQIEARLRSLKENGFINYYGFEYFGTRTHLIGKQLLLNQWKDAIDLILEEFKGQHQFHSIETMLLSYMKKHGGDLVGALNTIPYEMRLSYIHAYQSFIWNSIVSRRIAEFGLRPTFGDLVYATSTDEDDTYSIIEKGDDESQQQMESENSDSSSQAESSPPKIVFVDKNNIHYYTVDDVVLPLPGYDVTYPTNEVVNWYKDFLLADGLSEMDFERSTKNYNLIGAYRRLTLKPSDLNYKFVQYSNPTERLVLSDLDRLEKIRSPQAMTAEQTKQLKMSTRSSSKLNLENSSTSSSLSKSSEPDEKETVLPSSVDSEDGCDAKSMSYAEKKQLSCDIRMLPGDKLGRIVHIFRSLEPELGGSDPDEVVLDLEKLQQVTLRTLQTYVKSCLNMKPRTYGKKQSDKGKERLNVRENLTAEKVYRKEDAENVDCLSGVGSGIGLNSSFSPMLTDLERGGDFLGLVLEFNLPPSSYASMVVRELMKVDDSAMFEKGNGPSVHSSQGAIKSSDLEESRKKRSTMHESSIFSEVSSPSESPQKPLEKRLKLCDLS